MYYVYMIRCEDDSLYTGITSNLNKRMKEHFYKTNRCAKYTRSHTAKRLEACWNCETRSEAAKCEYAIKKLSKNDKEKLIINPDYLNIFEVSSKGNYMPIGKKQLDSWMREVKKNGPN